MPRVTLGEWYYREPENGKIGGHEVWARGLDGDTLVAQTSHHPSRQDEARANVVLIAQSKRMLEVLARLTASISNGRGLEKMLSIGDRVCLHYQDSGMSYRKKSGVITLIDAVRVVVESEGHEVTFLSSYPEWVTDASGVKFLRGVISPPGQKIIIESFVSDDLPLSNQQLDAFLMQIIPEAYSDTIAGVLLRPTVAIWRKALLAWYKRVNNGS